MGPSGSGKTTLLCALSLRLDLNRMSLSGEIRMNGKPYGTRLLKGMSGFVMQDDLLHAHFTVQEVLWYAAALRMSHGITVVDRMAHVDEVLNQLNSQCDHWRHPSRKRYKRDAPKTNLKKVSKEASSATNAEGGIPLEPDIIHLEADDVHKENVVHNPADSKTIAAFQHPPINLDFGVEKDDFTLRAVIPWFYQFSILFLRCSQEWVRRWDVLLINVSVATLIGCFAGYGPWSRSITPFCFSRLFFKNRGRLPSRLFFVPSRKGTHDCIVYNS